jgi:NTP pyrophosphatase (non-canonical NTP hydrolase)
VREKHPVYELADKVEVAKGQDYNIGVVKREDYFPLGLLSYGHMVHWEATRVLSLAEGTDPGGEKVKYEKLKEHLGDLVNYCKFTWDAVETEEKKRGIKA